MKKVRIKDRLVGGDEPCFIIAEAGSNHNGKLEQAKKLIDAASEAKADAVKFQLYTAEDLYSRYTPKFNYLKGKSTYDLIKSIETPREWIKDLVRHCEKKDIMFLASPFDFEAVDLLDKYVPAFKIASFEIVDMELLKYVAEKGKPMILSTGMANLGEIEDAINSIKSVGNEDIILLHCASLYPSPAEIVNLNAVETMKAAFKVPVGFSDHTLGIHISIASVALGACMIEKHFTLDRDLPGPDHKASLEPNELRSMVTAIREVEKALGDGVKMPTEDEEEIKKIARRSIIAKENIDEGSIIERGMLCFKRPGTGIEPKSMGKVVGSKAKKAIRKDEIITMDKIHDKEDG
jgi:N,N'-diacetyllegionaminate synthase